MAEQEFGDFEEVVDPKKEQTPQQPSEEEQAPTRLRLPKERFRELLGIVTQRLGGNRMEVKTTDGKSRNCRVPGRFRRKFWLRPGDPVIIIPWETDDNKADIVFQYKKGAKHQIRKRGFLDSIKNEF